MKRSPLIVGVLSLLLLASCSIGSRTPSSLSDTPIAPTTVPLAANTAAPTTVATVPATAATSAPQATTAAPAALAPLPSPLTLPAGFVAGVYAENVGKARGLALDAQGRVYVTDIGGRVLRLATTAGADGLHAAEAVITDLNQPHGITFHDGALYVGETNQVVRFEQQGDSFGPKTVIVPNLPTGGHRTRTVVFGTDGKLYVSVGSSCNVCSEEDERRAAVMQYNADGSGGQLFTRGLRNAVGLTLQPDTGRIWATNNGRDMLGEDLPPETVNVLAEGADFGWPRCHSGRIVDPEFGSAEACQGVAAPAVEMQAHSAPLGLAFYTGTQFPGEYQGNLFVAFHGSWNRSIPTGYKVVRIPVDANGNAGPAQDFAVGWQAGTSEPWGRPVDVLVAPDGSMLVSDDEGERIFRIAYQG